MRLLETGDRSLEESLALFQEGVELVKLCQARLDEAEGKIEELLGLKGGEPVTRPFTPPGGQS